MLRRLVPTPLRQKFTVLRKNVVYPTRYYWLKIHIALNVDVKLILGAALTSQSGWFSTNEQWFDIASPTDWQKIFKGKKLLRAAVAEHVFEHLTNDQTDIALVQIYEHMIPSGTIRIAVPDGNNPNKEYIKHVRIKGIGADAADHKQLLTFESLKQSLQLAGFTINLVEGYTKDGALIQDVPEARLGDIRRTRSKNANARTADATGWSFPDANTSLIVDGQK